MTLDEIRKALLYHQRGKAKLLSLVMREESGDIPTKEEWAGAGYKLEQDYPFEMIEALLPIAEAAVKLDVSMFTGTNRDGEGFCNGCNAAWTIRDGVTHEADCPVSKLLDALRALE